MRSVLFKMIINGIKCIDKEIELDFYKNSLTKKFDNSKSHVKAIYGPNGAGKTGIIYAADIFRNLILNSAYLTLSNASGSLHSIINQTSKEFYVKMVFGIIGDNNEVQNVYSHYINIKSNHGTFVLYEEELKKLSGLKINMSEKYKTIFHIKDGKFIELLVAEELPKINEMTMNLLNDRSFASIIHEIISKKRNDLNFSEKIKEPIYDLLFFAYSMRVLMQNNDKNYINIDYIYNQLNAIGDIRERVDKNIFEQLLVQDRIPKRDVVRVPKKIFGKYQTYVDNLTSFIKVFKDDLDDIAIKKDQNGDCYECELVLCYKDGKKVNLKYESTGIKKIISFYAALCDIEKGCIVFIDEFDANLHDVLLVKLVEYIMQYSLGQFIFTTHNLGPMDVLQKASKSIDFLSPDSRIVPWVKNGNYTAASQYSKGLVEYSPFNIEAFSFLGVFGDE